MFSDLHAAFRTLRRAPAFAATTALTLGLGIGATTALFTAVRGVLLRPLPYPDADRIVQIAEVNQRGNTVNVTDPNFADWHRAARTVRAMAQYQSWPGVVAGGAAARRVPLGSVSREFFDVMGVRPVVGRAFVPEEQQPGALPAAVVAEGFWRSVLGASPDLGRLSVTVDGTRARVVGVMPAGFDFPGGAAVWLPRDVDPPGTSRSAHNSQVVARLAPGATAAAAQREFSGITRALRREYGRDMDAQDAAVVPLRDAVVGPARVPLLLLFGAAGVLLLVAATNVATLFTARAESRRRELGVRVAVGATAGRLARQFLAESGVIAAAGALLGVLVSMVGTRALAAAGEAAGVPRPGDVRVDAAVVGFAFAVAALATGALGGAVARRAVREAGGGAALITGERAGTAGRAGARGRSALVAAQVALTAVLLVGAGLLARSFVRLVAVDPGFRTGDAVVVSLDVPGAPGGDTTDNGRARQALDAMLARLRAFPGVRAAGGVTLLPVGNIGSGGDGTFVLQSRPDEVRTPEDVDRLLRDPARTGSADFRKASDGYFEAMRIPLLRGRTFDARDGAGAPQVAVISASLARTRFAGRDPLGTLIQFGNMDGDSHPMTVVGVVGDVRERGLDAEPRATVYALARQRGRVYTFNVVLAGGAGFDEAATSRAARRAAREVVPEASVEVRPIGPIISRTDPSRSCLPGKRLPHLCASPRRACVRNGTPFRGAGAARCASRRAGPADHVPRTVRRRTNAWKTPVHRGHRWRQRSRAVIPRKMPVRVRSADVGAAESATMRVSLRVSMRGTSTTRAGSVSVSGPRRRRMANSAPAGTTRGRGGRGPPPSR